MRKILAYFAVVALLAGCATKFEQGGSYNPAGISDKPFMIADSTYQIAHGIGMTVFHYELDNRAALWKLSPEIKHTLDKIRPVFVQYNSEYLHARATYVSVPSTPNLDTLTGASQKMQEITTTLKGVIIPDKYIP